MSIFKALDAVIKALENIRASFFEGASGDKRKLAWIKWLMLSGRTHADFNNLLMDISSLDIDVGRDTPIFTLSTDNIYSVSVA
nr:reverse transcriptase domain, reverse transcriptase zinc-binding domain protein [Tanacetum cinerariifolium]